MTNNAQPTPVIQVILPSPLRRSFDYLPADGLSIHDYQIGQRVEAPFGNRKLIGLVIDHQADSSVDPKALKLLSAPLDQSPLISTSELSFLRWVADYYLHPEGETVFSLLPAYFTKSRQSHPYTEELWHISDRGLGLPHDALKRAPKQQQLLNTLRASQNGVDVLTLKTQGLSRAVLRELKQKALIYSTEVACVPPDNQFLKQGEQIEAPLKLTQEQSQALEPTLNALKQQQFHTNLINGITGSGKTEVYLQAAAAALAQGKQVLVLVPEIALTPQTLQRFTRRLNCKAALFHSALNDKERAAAWQAMQSGHANLMLGTRSAVATPMKRPGLIVIDEEHDSSYTQQDGLRYSARDIGVARANKLNIPIVLGSATPSLESLHNATQEKYHLSTLEQRSANSKSAELIFIDTRKQALHGGFSDTAIEAISETLSKQKQVLVFVNRRGYAPQLLCHDCGWSFECPRCDAKLTFHKAKNILRCHHCNYSTRPQLRCQRCQSTQIKPVGEGTEQLEEVLQRLFAGTPLIRIDRDTASTSNLLHEALEKIHQHPKAIIVGTQMLAKGHHFPNIETVVMLNTDHGLYGTDFRSLEKTLQLLTQVAGRAGRTSQSGKVFIQTHLPDHPQLTTWRESGYAEASRQLLPERELRGLPPFGFLASIGADSTAATAAQQFLKQAKQQLMRARQQLGINVDQLDIIGPFPAVMERRAGRHRAHLLLKAPSRKALKHCLRYAIPELEKLPRKSGLRWQIDIDPQTTV